VHAVMKLALKQVSRFSVTGAGAFCADFVVYSVLAKAAGMHPLLANLFSRPIGGLFGFLVNRHWTFENQGKAALRVQFVRYWIVWAASTLASEVLVGLFHEGLHLGPLTTKILAECVIGAVNFFCHKFWIFHGA
jgi:putative flippase GtrA